MSMREARWWLSVLIAFGALFGAWACGSSTEIPTVAEDPWATPEEEPEPEPDAGRDAGPDISTFPPCGNGGMCNPNNLGGETCPGLGMGDGILACDAVTCTYDTSMCEGTGTGGSGGNGSVGVGNGNGNMGGTSGGQESPFAAPSSEAPSSGNRGGAGNGASDEGNTPQFFGGGFFGGGNDGAREDSDPGNQDRDRDRDADSVEGPMDAGPKLDASI
jgi:hypothetical protein